MGADFWAHLFLFESLTILVMKLIIEFLSFSDSPKSKNGGPPNLLTLKPLSVHQRSPQVISKPYIPRSKRKEWIPVGLLGKLYVRDNGLCSVGARCDCEFGIAVPGNRWWVLARSGPNVIQILYR